LRHALSINPEGDYAKSSLATLQLLDGKATEALATFQSIGLESFRDSGVAIAQHMLRNTQASQTALDTLIAQAATSGPYQIAEVYAWRGEKDLAFEWLERAYHLQDGASAVQIGSAARIAIFRSTRCGDGKEAELTAVTRAVR